MSLKAGQLSAISEEDAGANGFSRPGSRGALLRRLGIVQWFAQMIDNLVGREEVMDLDL